jgi:Ca2+-transporting ATPase
MDPPRAEVRDAVRVALAAGIRPVMITGDHPLTAREIARQLGILPPDGSGQALTGQDLNQMTDEGFLTAVEQVSVYARVTPEHKLRIVGALQQRGQIVAMTGDGVNDAPALRKADIGVAMGITGTDVSKEAADMVLQDDNFATIVAAVEEGRTIYDNLRKFITFSVAGNIGKVLVMVLAPFLGKPLPLLPLQLLWLNLLTDGLLGLALGLEPPERDVMRRPPYSPKEGVFSGGLGATMLLVGGWIGALGLGVGYVYFRANPSGNWETLVFTTLAFAQAAQMLASRSRIDSLFQLGWRSNRIGILLVVAVILLQILAVYAPFLQSVLQTEAASIGDILICAALGSTVFFGIEFHKWRLRRSARMGKG